MIVIFIQIIVYSNIHVFRMNQKTQFVIKHFIWYFSDIPKVHLEFGKNLDTKNIKEGDDAYFECHVEARPEITKIQWMHNVSKTPRKSIITRASTSYSCVNS